MPMQKDDGRLMRLEQQNFTIDLGENGVIDVDISPVLNTTVVPKPKPKLIARLVIGVGDPQEEGGVQPLELDCRFTIRDR